MARFTDEELARYSRHMIVPEVGGVGQEHLCAASASARSEVEALYLAAAGVGNIAVPSRAIADAVVALNPLVTVTITNENGNENENGNDNANADGVDESSMRAWRTLKRVLAL